MNGKQLALSYRLVGPVVITTILLQMVTSIFLSRRHRCHLPTAPQQVSRTGKSDQDSALRCCVSCCRCTAVFHSCFHQCIEGHPKSFLVPDRKRSVHSSSKCLVPHMHVHPSVCNWFRKIKFHVPCMSIIFFIYKFGQTLQALYFVLYTVLRAN